jgi:hypothetical protein
MVGSLELQRKVVVSSVVRRGTYHGTALMRLWLQLDLMVKSVLLLTFHQ